MDHGQDKGSLSLPCTAERMMTDGFVSLPPHETAGEALERIRDRESDGTEVWACYISDAGRRPIGRVSLRALLLAAPHERLASLMQSDLVTVGENAESAEVAAAFQRQEDVPLPVVDGQGVLIGAIPPGRIVDALRTDAEEDLARMAAITPSETPYLMASAWKVFLSRIPWLLLLMISATFTGLIISSFEAALSACVYLTAFIPMLMDTGGNSGNQASVTVIRALSLGEIGFRDLLRVVKKEATVALLCAAALGIASYVKIYVVDHLLLRTLSGAEALFVPAVVAVTLFCTVLFAKLVGASLPIAAKRLGFDPAVMASPFITTLVDTVSLAIYFQVAHAVIPSL